MISKTKISRRVKRKTNSGLVETIEKCQKCNLFERSWSHGKTQVRIYNKRWEYNYGDKGEIVQSIESEIDDELKLRRTK